MMFRFPESIVSNEDVRGGAGAPGMTGRPAIAQSNRPEVLVMKWEIPQATDFRFGMEITMYVANR